MKKRMKRLLSELLKNSKRSDRQLAKVLGVSQPTVTRMRQKLEKEGYIREYTLIPDFRKLGYELMSLTFVKLRKGLDREDLEKTRKTIGEDLKKSPFAIIMTERGSGLGYEGVTISLHENYSSYAKHLGWLRQWTFLQIFEIESFLISLHDKARYRPLTFAYLAQHLLKLEEKEEKK